MYRDSCMHNGYGKTAAAVLAGGSSRRYGSNKSEVMLGGRSLLWRALSYGRRYTDRLFILSKEAPISSYGSTVLLDKYTVSTPISGILTVSPFVQEWLLLLACDIVLPDPSMLDLLFSSRQEGKASVFRIAGTLQPFLALYPQSLLGYWEDAYSRGEYRLRGIVESMPRVEIDEDDLQKAGFTDTPLFNINNPEELRKVENLVQL
jgi:molybdenum cofactor guanylyltransferase